MKQGGAILAAGRVRWKRKTNRKKAGKNSSHPNTPRNQQQPGDRDNLEKARYETADTIYPILARFYRFQVVEIGPVPLSQSV